MRLSISGWIEILGLLPATLFIGPIVGYATFGAIIVIVASLVDTGQPFPRRLATARSILMLLLPLAGALSGLVAAWIVALMGVDCAVRTKPRKIVSQALLLCGIASGLFWLKWTWSYAGLKGTFARGYWMLSVSAAVGVAAYQSYLLLTAKPTTAT
jgi:hypothetical protein